MSIVEGKAILITGGAGFIGSTLAQILHSGNTVHLYDNLHPQVHDGNPDNLRIAEANCSDIVDADIRDFDKLKQTIASTKPDIVYHLAAETGTGQSYDELARYNGVNVTGTVNLVEAIREAHPGVQKVILAGSRSVYGEGAYVGPGGSPSVAKPRPEAALKSGQFEVIDDDGNVLAPAKSNASTPVQPASIYASTKLMQEYLLLQSFWGSPTAVGILRLQNVFGERQSLNNPYTGVISIFINQIKMGKELRIFEDGEIYRDFVHVSDVAEAFARSASADSDGEIIDIGSGEAKSIMEVAQKLLVLLGESADKLSVTGEYRPGDIRHACADISAAERHLGWTPAVGFEDGVERVVRWSDAQQIKKAHQGH